ncbi:MAG: DNA repair protein RecO [candidate division Zixibacteria bacterium]|nr:DNA repair protein RecO [candidate division Zixibacteria bacterium]
MSLEKTEAVVLKAFNWSESSRTVIFFSHRFGKLALVDKGGRSFKSKRGRIVGFAVLEITFYDSQKESSGYIRDVDPLETFSFEKEGTMGRLAYGSAACELLHLLLPEEETQIDLYDYFVGYLKCVDVADKRSLPALFLAFFLRTLSHLGYHPSLTHCAACGRADQAGAGQAGADQVGSLAASQPADYVSFCAERGGVVCSSCQTPADQYIRLSSACFEQLVTLQSASLAEAAAMPITYADTELLLEALTRFVSCQTGVSGELKSLEFLRKLKKTKLS